LNLDLFNNLINKTKENNLIQSFIKELGEFLENNLCNNERNEESLVQTILDGRTLTTRYRDKINMERHDIVKEYSKEHEEEGEFFYVYNKRSDNSYGLVGHKKGEDGNNIGVKESELPEGAGVDCVLRLKNGEFELDKVATEEIQEELTEMINRLLEEQERTLEEKRIEGHVYEFVEEATNMVVLTDVTSDTGECFEEINFPRELLSLARDGSMFKYESGEYEVLK